ncbi:MAG: alpha/beta hydrolase [Thermoanaerobaculia bacterium]|nr:alpha/beta hydrolase [Thermoanaerobaculia bacterium]
MGETLEIDGRRLEVRRFGELRPDTPALVLLHEGLGCVALWKDFPDRLAAATGLPVVAYSRLGYGGSDPAPLPRGVDFMHREAQDTLPSLLRALRIDRAVLLGHSDGGSIALIHAATVRPSPVVGVVAEAPHVFVEEITLRSIRAAAVSYRDGDLRRRLLPYHGANVDGAFRGWSDVWLDPAFRDWDLRGLLCELTVPVLVLQGDADPYGTLAQVEAIRDGCAGEVETKILSGCGHAPHVERPRAILDAASAFVAELLGRS